MFPKRAIGHKTRTSDTVKRSAVVRICGGFEYVGQCGTRCTAQSKTCDFQKIYSVKQFPKVFWPIWVIQNFAKLP